ncbi:MAG: hypothetical protein V1753_11550 [Pseudomonadota bacterium]
MRLEGLTRPKCPTCGKELAVHSRYGETAFNNMKRRIIAAYPELADEVGEWNGRTSVTRYRCSRCKVIYNASLFGDKKYYNETKEKPEE